ncbi:MAG: divalent metal cation transporter [Candidatus Dormibacteria bacterium]
MPATAALIDSQVVLSVALPCALVPLIWATSSRRLMGELANRRATTALAALGSAAIVALAMWAIVGG